MDVDCRPAGKVQLGQHRPRKVQCRPSRPSTVNVDQIEKMYFWNLLFNFVNKTEVKKNNFSIKKNYNFFLKIGCSSFYNQPILKLSNAGKCKKKIKKTIINIIFAQQILNRISYLNSITLFFNGKAQIACCKIDYIEK